MAAELAAGYVSLTAKLAKGGMADVTKEVKKAGQEGGKQYSDEFSKQVGTDVAKKLPEQVKKATTKTGSGGLAQAAKEAAKEFGKGLQAGIQSGLSTAISSGNLTGALKPLNDKLKETTGLVKGIGDATGVNVKPIIDVSQNISNAIGGIGTAVDSAKSSLKDFKGGDIAGGLQGAVDALKGLENVGLPKSFATEAQTLVDKLDLANQKTSDIKSSLTGVSDLLGSTLPEKADVFKGALEKVTPILAAFEAGPDVQKWTGAHIPGASWINQLPTIDNQLIDISRILQGDPAQTPFFRAFMQGTALDQAQGKLDAARDAAIRAGASPPGGQPVGAPQIVATPPPATTPIIPNLALPPSLRRPGQHARGGVINGPGGTDNVLGWLTAGEGVVTKAAMQNGGAAVVAALNQMPHYDTGGAVGGERWRPTVAAVVDKYGPMVGITPANRQAWIDAIVKQIQFESGGNPGADNPNDPTGRGGTQHVSGLLQYLPSSYAMSGGKLTGLPFMDPVGQIAGALFAPRTAGGAPSTAGGGIGGGHGWGPVSTAISGAPGNGSPIGSKPGDPVYVQPVGDGGTAAGGGAGTPPTGLGPSGSFQPGGNPYAQLASLQKQQDQLDQQKAAAIKGILPDFGQLGNIGVQGIRDNLPPGFFDYSQGKTAASIGNLLKSIGILTGNPQAASIMGGIGSAVTGDMSGLYSGIMGAIPGPVGTLAPGQIGAPDLIAANSGGGGAGVHVDTLNDNSGKSLENAQKTAQFNTNTPQSTTVRRMGV